MSTFSKFTKRYKPSSKTLRFTLIPQGKTQEQIAKTSILSQDFIRAKEYALVKQILDKHYKNYLNERLLKIDYDWQPLYDAHKNYNATKDESLLKEARNKCLKDICKLLVPADKKEESINPKAIIESIVKNKVEASNEEYGAISQFNKFATYFEGYRENRENIFGEKQKRKN